VSITDKKFEEVRTFFESGGRPDLFADIEALIKPKRKNKKRTPFFEAVHEHFLTNDIITVDDMKAMPAYPEENRKTRGDAVKKAAKEQGFQFDKDGKFIWFKVKDNTEAYDAIHDLMQVDRVYPESKMREWCEKHKTGFDATVEAMKERGVRVNRHLTTKKLTFKVIP